MSPLDIRRHALSPGMVEGDSVKLPEPQERRDTEQPAPDRRARAIGAVRIQLQSASLRKEAGLRSFFPLPSPFVEISINEKQVIGCSKQAHRTRDPYWFPQAFHALIHSSQDYIALSVLDGPSSCRGTKLLGKATFPVVQLEMEPFHLAISEILWKRDKERGFILFDIVSYKPVRFPGIEDESTMGIIILTLYEARDLSWDVPTGRLKPRVVARIETDATSIQLTLPGSSGDPKWYSQCEILAMHGRRTRLILEVKSGSSSLGHIDLPLGDILSEEEHNDHWWPLNGSPRGQLRLGADWEVLSTGQDDIIAQ